MKIFLRTKHGGDAVEVDEDGIVVRHCGNVVHLLPRKFIITEEQGGGHENLRQADYGGFRRIRPFLHSIPICCYSYKLDKAMSRHLYIHPTQTLVWSGQ